MKDFFIVDAPKFENKSIDSYFVLSSIQARERKQGGAYLAAVLSDKTGSFDARMWEDFSDALDGCTAGSYVKVRGLISNYQGKFQITLQKMRNAAESEVEPGDFLAITTRDIDAMWAELRGHVDGFTNKDLKRLVLAFLDDEEIAAAYKKAPAAKLLHHAWIGGLLEHVVGLLAVIKVVGPCYPEANLDLIMTGAILHDIGKTRELAWKTSFRYTLEGQLVGHISIAMGMLREKIQTLPDFPDKLRILVEHMILSHHGEYEFGSPKLPMLPEAMIFHMIDDLEAKMQAVRTEFELQVRNGAAPGEMTERMWALDNRQVLNTKRYLEEK
ncbi:MAG TPA: HD domain-containing protein [Acidobacteriaceae bacterium]|jgi:3'-5' exoribonuclease|nr:HD domain-containing protein [Acidobacteriaceae bacterium]